MNFGVLLLTITILGYLSHWLNSRYLNNWFFRLSYFFGTLIHESSHAIACILTGARIEAFKVFATQPRVSHSKSRLPIFGQAIISLAPLLGGLILFYLLNQWIDHTITLFTPTNFHEVGDFIKQLISQLKFNNWQTYLLIFIGLNAGAMIGPSTQDLKNIWPLVILSFFITFLPLINMGLIACGLLLTNIILQLVLILILKTIKLAQ